MIEQINKDKKKILIVAIFCLILIVAMLGYTYAFIGLDDKTATIIGAETECYTVNYTKGQDISGNLTSGIDYTSGESTDILMYTEPDCSLMYGTLYLTTNASSTIDFSKEVLKYSVLLNDKVVSEGIVNGEENQVIYTNFILNDTKTTYQVYIWLDEELEEYIQVGDTFSGFVHADAILASHVTKYVMEGSVKATSEDDEFLSTSIKRNEINSISFIDTDDIETLIGNEEIKSLQNVEYDDLNIPYFDVSIEKDKSVKLYYKNIGTEDNNLYDVMIGTEIGKTIASDGYNLFSTLVNMVNIDLRNLDTSRVDNMSQMFNYCLDLLEIDLSNFNTSNVTDMSYMFDGFYAAPDNTIDPYAMSLEKIKGLENFDTSNVTNMSGMFNSCYYLESINLSNFNTSNVTNMSGMFQGISIVDFDLSSFNTSNVTDMSFMFDNVNRLSADLSGFDTSNVTNMAYMFANMFEVFTLDLSSFNTANVTNMSGMFSGGKLSKIYVSDKFTTTNVKNSRHMFYDNTFLTGGAGTRYDSEHIDATYARIDGGTANPGYFTDINDLLSTN